MTVAINDDVKAEAVSFSVVDGEGNSLTRKQAGLRS